MRIPRKFIEITAEQLAESSGGIVGDIWKVVRNEYNELIGTNTRTGKRYLLFASHLRNDNFYRFIEGR